MAKADSHSCGIAERRTGAINTNDLAVGGDLAGATCSPWLAAMFLTLEASNVIGLRLMKIAAGGSDALTEAHLMVSEKIAAAFEMTDLFNGGGTPEMVIDRYRAYVGANASRLSSPAI